MGGDSGNGTNLGLHFLLTYTGMQVVVVQNNLQKNPWKNSASRVSP